MKGHGKWMSGAVAALVFTLSANAENLTLTNGTVYKNITVTKVEPDGLRITHSEGGGKISFTQLPPDIQQKYHYDPAAAEKYAAEQEAKRKASLEQILRKNAPTNASPTVFPAAAPPAPSATPPHPFTTTNLVKSTPPAAPVTFSASATSIPPVPANPPASTDANMTTPVTTDDLIRLASLVDINGEAELTKLTGVTVKKGYYWWYYDDYRSRADHDRHHANKNAKGRSGIWKESVDFATELLRRPYTSKQESFIRLFLKASELAGTDYRDDYRKTVLAIKDQTSELRAPQPAP